MRKLLVIIELLGSYKNIEAGQTAYALRDLTGAPYI
jgi:hypothetical protein